MSVSAKVPCTIVTGFLGAGKTSLIRNLLATANGHSRRVEIEPTLKSFREKVNI